MAAKGLLKDGAASAYGAAGPVRGEDSDPEDRMAERSLSWMGAAWVVNASVIGMGVLTIPRCFATLGWLCGWATLVVCLLANILVAHIMLEIREVHPQAISLADAAQCACDGSRSVKVTLRTVLFAEKLACTCAFVNLMVDTLGSAFYSLRWCEVSWCGVIVLIFLPLMRLKSLSETHGLNLVNFASILIVVALTCVAVLQEAGAGGATSWRPAARDFSDAIGAVSMLVFSFSGNWMYFELMAEMRQPRDFIKCFGVAGPTQLGLYGLMGGVGYAALGDAAPTSMVEALRFSWLMRVISLVLTVHIVCGTATNLVVLTRFFHSRVSPGDVNCSTARAQLVRGSIFLAVISGAVLVTLMIQSLGPIVTLIGALFEAPISFILPMAIYAGVMRGQPPKQGWGPRLLWLGGAAIAAFGAVTMVFGVMDAVRSFKPSSRHPFACNCEGIWDTCECSPSRMSPGACGVTLARHSSGLPLFPDGH